MIEALFEGLGLILQWKPLAFMLIGIVVGFWVGLLPGLGGATTLALMLPFIYGMQPVEAFAFLFLVHPQAYQHLGDHQQDQRAHAAIDQRRGDALTLDPELMKYTRTAIGGRVACGQEPHGEHAGQQRNEAVHVRDGELRPPGKPGPAGEEDAQEDAAREQAVRDHARCARGVPVDPVHDVWLATGGLPPDDGAIEPPPSEEPSSSREEELPAECDTLVVDVGVVDVPVAGCPCRATARRTAKPAAAVRATARFAALARLRPASILVACGMSPFSPPSLRRRCEKAKSRRRPL